MINIRESAEAPIAHYQPRGSMCAACEHRDRDCSGLPFDEMRVLEMGRGAGDRIYAVVRCVSYSKGLPA